MYEIDNSNENIIKVFRRIEHLERNIYTLNQIGINLKRLIHIIIMKIILTKSYFQMLKK